MDSNISFLNEDNLTSFDSNYKIYQNSFEDTNYKIKNNYTPVLTRYKTIVFSKHENSVKVIKQHQFNLYIVLLIKEKLIKENIEIKSDLKKFLSLNPNEINFIHEKIGEIYIKIPAHKKRKQLELKLLLNIRQLKCLETKLIYLELIILEEKTRAKARIHNLDFKANCF